MPRRPTRVILEAIAGRCQKGAVLVDYERPFCCVVSRYLLRGRKRSLIKFFSRKFVRRISESRRSRGNLSTVSQQGAKKSPLQISFDIFLRSSQGIYSTPLTCYYFFFLKTLLVKSFFSSSLNSFLIFDYSKATGLSTFLEANWFRIQSEKYWEKQLGFEVAWY